jgi:hypothetical protein
MSRQRVSFVLLWLVSLTRANLLRMLPRLSGCIDFPTIADFSTYAGSAELNYPTDAGVSNAKTWPNYFLAGQVMIRCGPLRLRRHLSSRIRALQ